eukprot:5175202-Ditylum_brightwellii.AAC.1
MMRTRNLAGELEEMATDNKRRLMLMDSLCGLNLNYEGEDNDEMILNVEDNNDGKMILEENSLNSEEGDIALRITDKTKSEHQTHGKKAGFVRGDWKGMICTIKRILLNPTVTPSRPKFDFNLNEDSAKKNSETLKKYGYDMTRAIASNK